MKKVILSLGEGDLPSGFTSVSVQLWDTDEGGPRKWVGCLLGDPKLAQLSRDWQSLYRAYYQDLGRSIRLGIEGAGARFSPQEFRQTCQQLPKQLNDWLRTHSFLEMERKLRTHLQPSDEIQVFVETADRQLRQLPWHLWSFFEDYRQAEVALSLPEYEGGSSSRTPLTKEISLLGILGHCTSLEGERIDVQKDKALIEALPHIRSKFLQEPNKKELLEQLWGQAWDLLFFAGHSSSQPEGEMDRIYINQNPQNNSVMVDELKLALENGISQGLKLAIFNSCDGLGLARQLAQLKVPQIIVMREVVPDEVAQEFLRYFLQAFNSGKSSHLAVRQAREMLQENLEENFPCAGWLPALCQTPAVEPLTWLKLNDSSRDGLPSEGTAVSPEASELQPEVMINPLRPSPKRPWLVAATIALVGLGSLFLGSKIAHWANKRGMNSHKENQFFSAQLFYRMAALFDLDFASPHYNLGWLCKDMGDLDCAINAYYQAALRGLSEAYAEASRLQILNENYDGAIKGIHQCLERAEYDAVQAACWKNLGWVRFEQRRYEDAETHLTKAIDLANDSPHAHCLLAQVLEAQGQQDKARESWRETQSSIDSLVSRKNVPEYDHCIGMAKQQLQKEKR